MTEQAAFEAVHKSVVVEVSQERAFQVFTGDISNWWIIDSHHVGDDVPEAVVIEPFVGGRWFERSPNGNESDWGKVAEWDPNDRVTFAWHLAPPDWKFNPDPKMATDLEVKFIPIDTHRTEVQIKHSGFERYGDDGEDVRKAVASPNGWSGLLAGYAERVAAVGE